MVNHQHISVLQVRISIEESSPHETCTNARQISIPYATIDYNMNGESSTHFCSSGESNGVWYTFTVDKDVTVYASTCSSRIEFDSYISVGKGSCDNMECVAEVKDTEGCNGGGILNFTALKSMQYFVFMGGEQPSTSGEFEVSLWTRQPPETSSCSTPYEMDMTKRFVRFTTYTKYAHTTTMYLDYRTQTKKGTFIYIPEGYYGKFVVMTCATGTQIPTFISTHKGCLEYDDNSDAGMVETSTDYRDKACGSFGSYLQLELDGNEEFIFVGNANDGESGYIDIEILNQASKKPVPESSSSIPISSSSESSSVPVVSSSSSEPVPIISSSSSVPVISSSSSSVPAVVVSSSSKPTPVSSSSSKPMSSSESKPVDDDNEVPVAWLVIGLLSLVILTIGFVGVIVFIVLRTGHSSSMYTELVPELN